MDTTTLLVIIIVLLIFGGGWFGRNSLVIGSVRRPLSR